MKKEYSGTSKTTCEVEISPGKSQSPVKWSADIAICSRVAGCEVLRCSPAHVLNIAGQRLEHNIAEKEATGHSALICIEHKL